MTEKQQIQRMTDTFLKAFTNLIPFSKPFLLHLLTFSTLSLRFAGKKLYDNHIYAMTPLLSNLLTVAGLEPRAGSCFHYYLFGSWLQKPVLFIRSVISSPMFNVRFIIMTYHK